MGDERLIGSLDKRNGGVDIVAADHGVLARGNGETGGGGGTGKVHPLVEVAHDELASRRTSHLALGTSGVSQRFGCRGGV